MGGGDLNLKKSWHPGTLKNQTIVWQRQQKLIEEQKRLKELRKELEDEREKERLYELQGKRKQRLEWMYSASHENNPQQITKDKEELLLGRKTVDWSKYEDAPQVVKEFERNESNSQYGINANTDHDFKAKVRDDPLLIFKKQEQEALQQLGASNVEGKVKKHKSKKPKREDRLKSRSRSPNPRNSETNRSSKEYYRERPLDNYDKRGRSPRDYRRDRSPRDYNDRYRDRRDY
jgi:hypothetical protein